MTRKGRIAKERAVYEKYKPLIERYFDLVMPAYSETIHIIGFDGAGTPILPTHTAPATRSFTERSRVGKVIRAQLDEVLAKVRPGIDLDRIERVGQAGMWIRTVLAYTVPVAAAMLGLSIVWPNLSSGAAITGGLVLQMLPGLLQISGWVLIAHYFRRRWVWLIPLLIGLSWLWTLGTTIWRFGFIHDPDQLWFWDRLHSVLGLLINFSTAAAILLLGLVLTHRRSRVRDTSPPA